MKQETQDTEKRNMNREDKQMFKDGSEDEEVFADPLDLSSPRRTTFASIESDGKWGAEATRFMLIVYKVCIVEVGKNGRIKKKSEMWEIIRHIMAEQGYRFDAIQIATRFNTLKRGYERLKVSRAGKKLRVAANAYSSELEEIFGRANETQTIADEEVFGLPSHGGSSTSLAGEETLLEEDTQNSTTGKTNRKRCATSRTREGTPLRLEKNPVQDSPAASGGRKRETSDSEDTRSFFEDTRNSSHAKSKSKRFGAFPDGTPGFYNCEIRIQNFYQTLA